MNKFRSQKNILARTLDGHDRLETSVLEILAKNKYDAYIIRKSGPGWTVSCGRFQDPPKDLPITDPNAPEPVVKKVESGFLTKKKVKVEAPEKTKKSKKMEK